MSPMAIQKLISDTFTPSCVSDKNELVLDGTDDHLTQSWLEVRLLRCGSDELIATQQQDQPSVTCQTTFKLQNYLSGKTLEIYRAEKFLDFSQKDDPVRKAFRKIASTSLSMPQGIYNQQQ